jgi:WD repeat-containing protein 24
MRNSVIRLHHPTAVRTAAFSCSQACPVHAVVGLDNGSLYRSVTFTSSLLIFLPSRSFRYDFSQGSKGQLDRLPVAHTGPILTFDWCAPEGGVPGAGGWIASGSLDRTVKVWDITSPHLERAPTYTIATQFPVRRVRWRPGYECELAIASNAEFGMGSMSDVSDSGTLEDADLEKPEVAPMKRRTDIGNAVEIWDVRRGYIAKWQVGGSAIEGGVAGRSPYA